MVHCQHDFYKESSKIKGSHMVPMKKWLFYKDLRTYKCEKWLVFVVFGHTGFYNPQICLLKSAMNKIILV